MQSWFHLAFSPIDVVDEKIVTENDFRCDDVERSVVGDFATRRALHIRFITVVMTQLEDFSNQPMRIAR